jgi:TP901-1 family phage major tail protein
MADVKILLMVNTGTDLAPVWKTVGGQRSATFSEETETKDVTSEDSDGAQEFEYGLYTWNVDCDGVYVKAADGFDALKNAMRNKEKIKVRMSENDVDVEEGLALVTSRELEGSYDSESTYSMSLQGSGKLSPVTP